MKRETNEVLLKIFGQSMHTRVILFLYQNRDFIGSISDLARALNVSRGSIKKVVDDLIDVHLLKNIRVGMSILVRFDFNSPLTRSLFEFLDKIYHYRRVVSDIERKEEK